MSNTNNYYDVDVDNPKWQPNLNSIATHSKIADYYKYRPPYLAELFHIGAIKMKLRKSDKLLDLCCGRGELANGFSNYVDKINAIDGSSQMLKNSIARNNISYHLADVNHDEMNFIEEIDHIVIGSAIHWVSQKNMENITTKHLNPSGHIFISHTLFKYDDQPYADKLHKLNEKYGKKYKSVDLWGKTKLEKSGFSRVDGIRLTRKVSISIDDFYKNQLSYAYHDFNKITSEKRDDYKSEFIDLMTPLSQNSKISASLVNWADIYARMTK